MIEPKKQAKKTMRIICRRVFSRLTGSGERSNKMQKQKHYL